MIIVTYDISSDRVRTRFSKYLTKFGRKLQYSVYEIRNSNRVKANIQKEIDLRYKKHFQDGDSIILFNICERCKGNVGRYGYACNDEKDVVVFE
jgi:CRISPR-associated protein Cas2